MNFSSNGKSRNVASYRMGAPVEIPLVLLHGFCADSDVWVGVCEGLGHTGQILIDLPGFGQSDLPFVADMEDYASAVVTVLKHHDIERCVLVGHSMGGYVALEFAACYPERLAGLGLIHSHPYADAPERKDARRRAIEMLHAGKLDLYVSQFVPNLFAADNRNLLQPTVEAMVHLGQRQSAAALEMALTAMMNRKDRQETLAKAPYPVLFLLGQSDEVVPPELAMPAAQLPKMPILHLLSGTGHLAMLESPDETVGILRDFWEKCVKIPPLNS